MLYVGGLVLLTGASCLAYYGIGKATIANGTLKAAKFLAFASISFVGLAFAAAAVYQAHRHHLAAMEVRRVLRQLPAFELYIASLPSRTQHLLRAAMLQRLFPRILEDTDPLREPLWPTTKELLSSVDLKD